ncbi:MAG TPA: hypothetical protein VE953_27415 [Terriglobales bacterium]|nr:hypothetical protein [Terriglobales bacterium]
MAIVVLAILGLLAILLSPPAWVIYLVLFWGGLWLLFGSRRRMRRRERNARRARRWGDVIDQAPAPMPPPAPMPAPLPPPPQPVVNLHRLPADAEKQADRIRRKAAVLGQHPDRFPIGSKDLYTVQQTSAEYLPETVKTYLEVPTWSVDTPTADGRTPVQILTSQLDLLEGKLDEIAESVRKQRVDNLLANERFLEQNFGKPEPEELTLPH